MNEDILNEYEQEIPKDKLKFYIALFIAWLTIMILGFFLVLTYNKLANEQAKPKTIEEIRNMNLKYSTNYQKYYIQKRDKAQKLVDSYNKEIRDAEWCLSQNSTGWVATNCYILSRKAK